MINYVNTLKLSWLINETFPPCIYGLEFQEMLSQYHNIIMLSLTNSKWMHVRYLKHDWLIIIDCNWLVFGFCWLPTDIIVMILSNQLLIARTSINYSVNWMIFNCNKRKFDSHSILLACTYLKFISAWVKGIMSVWVWIMVFSTNVQKNTKSWYFPGWPISDSMLLISCATPSSSIVIVYLCTVVYEKSVPNTSMAPSDDIW